MVLLAWSLRSLLGLIALTWLGLALKTFVGRRRQRFHVHLDDPPAPDGSPGVSVVIPARDEQDNIGPCLRAVLAQDHSPLQVVVLDDASTDGTAQALQAFSDDPRVCIVMGSGEPSPDWFGKPWAVQRAQAHATQPWLLFLDADVRLDPRAISRALGYALRNELKMLSGFGRLVTAGFWEKVLQPVVGGIIVAGNNPDEVNDPERKDKAMANGQFILIQREAYDSIGQHGAVARDVLDDVGLARAAKRADVPYHCVFMRSLFSCRMYSGLGEIWRGWRKNLFAGMHYSWPVVTTVVSYLAVTNLLPWLVLLLSLTGVLGREWLIWSLGLVLLMQAVRLYLDLVFHHPPLYGPTLPLGMSMLLLLMLDSAWSSRSGRVAWKGRAVDVARPPPTQQDDATPRATGTGTA